MRSLLVVIAAVAFGGAVLSDGEGEVDGYFRVGIRN
jgi:ribose/xylose/arabinose/galactoside ABC-type transport system permease subunit